MKSAKVEYYGIRINDLDYLMRVELRWYSGADVDKLADAGARHYARRALQKYVEDPLSEALIQGQLVDTSLIEVFLDGDDLNYRPIGIEAPDDALLIH